MHVKSMYSIYKSDSQTLLFITGPQPSEHTADLVHIDKVNGLTVPNSGTKMLLATGDVVDVPSDYFVHPETGNVLPIHGNVAYDPVMSKLTITVDTTSGMCWFISNRDVLVENGGANLGFFQISHVSLSFGVMCQSSDVACYTRCCHHPYASVGPFVHLTLVDLRNYLWYSLPRYVLLLYVL